MAFDLIDELKRVLDAFDAAGVEAVLVGGLAVALHGAPRATRDIDLMVRPEDLDAALRAAATVGFRFPARPMAFRSSDISIQRVTQIRDGETLMLDLLLATGPLEALWPRSQVVAALGRDLRVVDLDALLEMKALAGRLQDLADIERLQGGQE